MLDPKEKLKTGFLWKNIYFLRTVNLKNSRDTWRILLKAHPDKQLCRIATIAPSAFFLLSFCSLINKNMYIYMLNFMSMLLLVYIWSQISKNSELSIISWCACYIFICFSSFVCDYMHIISLNEFCPFSLSQKKKFRHSKILYIYACMYIVCKNEENPKEM